jgi:predicted transporter
VKSLFLEGDGFFPFRRFEEEGKDISKVTAFVFTYGVVSLSYMAIG